MKKLERNIPGDVSYTHLDVYKRQTQIYSRMLNHKLKDVYQKAHPRA